MLDGDEMEPQEAFLYITVILIAVLIYYGISSFVLKPQTVETGSATKLVEKAVGSVWVLSDPDIKISSRSVESGFEYDIRTVLIMRFDSKTADEITLIPVLSFKGAKDRDIVPSNIQLKSGEPKIANLHFKLISKEPPIKILDKNTEFKCNTEELKDELKTCDSKSCSCEIQHRQKLLLKDFSFDFKTFQIDPSELPYAPPLLPKIGPCVLGVEILCPSDKRTINLKTPKESEPCTKQDNIDDCSKAAKMCGTVANVKLEKISSRESLLEKIAPGTPRCSDKFFAVDISVGPVEKSQFEWTVGEDIAFIFWEKTTKREHENCWQDETVECRNLLFVGEKTITIPLQSYVR